jgi:hypothetical protein
VDPDRTLMLGAWIRTLLTLAALFAVLDFMFVPMIVEWYRQRQRDRQR